MKQKLQKDLQLLMDLNNEYKEKEKDAKKVAEEKGKYKGTLTLFKERTEEEEKRILQYCEKEGKITDDMNIINLAIQITKNNIPETYLTDKTEVKKDENVHTEIILSEFLIGENNG